MNFKQTHILILPKERFIHFLKIFMIGVLIQWMIENRFCLEAYAGLGIGIKSTEITSSRHIEVDQSDDDRFFGFTSHPVNQQTISFLMLRKLGSIVLINKNGL